MEKPPLQHVPPHHVRGAVHFAVMMALRVLRIPGHWSENEAKAGKITDHVMAHLDRAGWTVWCPYRKDHSTPGPRREE